VFESAEIGHRITKARYKREEPKLREALLAAQFDLLQKQDFPVLILVAGLDGAGKGDTVNIFNEWMDPRHIRTEAFDPGDGADSGRPRLWPFWRSLPRKGNIGMFFGSWYSQPISERANGRSKKSVFGQELERIRHFERMLAAEGVLLLKLWFHLSEDAQRKRFKKLGANPLTSWRVSSRDREHLRNYERYARISAEALRETSTGEAPWQIIDGSDPHYRALTAGQLLLEAMRRRLDGPAPAMSPPAPPPAPSLDGRDLLNSLDYRARIAPTRYKKQLEKAQARVAVLTRDKRIRDRSLVCVFEGMDAAGKGSTIRRITRAMDARFYRVVPIAAPSDEERAQPYLWRFWRHLPRYGHATIFDRSWYGRVLVERVEGLCSEYDWTRGYHEINEFEEQMAESGTIVLKFWLSITAEEQLKRFRERETVAYKRHKITQEDWSNRKKWPKYERAVCDMIERTSTVHAPWHVVPANDKRFARVTVLQTLADALEAQL
jgi:AMP-polyphosphate phosphotransferase